MDLRDDFGDDSSPKLLLGDEFKDDLPNWTSKLSYFLYLRLHVSFFREVKHQKKKKKEQLSDPLEEPTPKVPRVEENTPQRY